MIAAITRLRFFSLHRHSWRCMLALFLMTLNANAQTLPHGVSGDSVTQHTLDSIAQHLDIRYQFISNQRQPTCDPERAAGACFHAIIHLRSDRLIKNNGWKIFFSHVEPIQPFANEYFELKHLNGDLHYLVPLQTLEANRDYAIPIQAAFWLLSESDIMPNWYVAAAALQARVIASTRTTIDRDSGLEQWPFLRGLEADSGKLKRNENDRTLITNAESDFAENENEIASDDAIRLIPQARSLQRLDNEAIAITQRGITVTRNEFSRAPLQAAFDRLHTLGVHERENGLPLNIVKSTASINDEAYSLRIEHHGIVIEAAHPTGAFYALQSIAALLQPAQGIIPAVMIEDAPRYTIRGMHIDIARNFHSKAQLLKVVDQMAAYKLNTLHLHFADDEGWRIAIASLPELTAIGAYRCHQSDTHGLPLEKHCLMPQLGSGPDRHTSVNGFYSARDYIDIIRAAQARHIRVLPSFDLPGHARAAVRSMRIRHDNLIAKGASIAEAQKYLLDDSNDRTRYQSIQYYNDNTINVCLPSALNFIDAVVTELQTLHRLGGQPLTRLHIGADETPGAWVDSPACHAQREQGWDHHRIGAQFIQSVAKHLHAKGIAIAAWNDGLNGIDPNTFPTPVQVNAWTPLFWNGHTSAQHFANLGWPVVLSFPDVSYFDFPYAAHPAERGYVWGSRANSEHKVFNFMPDNLAANAEFFRDRDNHPYQADDRPHKNDGSENEHAPLKQGVKFAGLQGQLWSETTRTDQQVDYMLFPRLLALAERAWHQGEWELPYDTNGQRYDADSGFFTIALKQQQQRDWQHFIHHLGKHELAKLRRADIAYRIAPPGAKVRDGKLWMNHRYALTVQYREAGKTWQNWSAPIAVTLPVELRALDDSGKRSSRVSALNTAALPQNGSR